MLADAVIGGVQVADGRQGVVQQAGADAGFELVETDVGGEDGGEFGVVAVVDELVEFFLGPGGGALRAQVVQDEEGSFADLLESFVIGGVALGVEGGPQVVQQVGDDDEEGGFPPGHALVGDGRGQVGFPRPQSTDEEEPAFGRVRETSRGLQGPAEGFHLGRGQFLLAQGEGVEGLVLQVFEVADALQPSQGAPLPLFPLAFAGDGLAEQGVPDGHVEDVEAQSPADGAGFFFPFLSAR